MNVRHTVDEKKKPKKMSSTNYISICHSDLFKQQNTTAKYKNN